jgi:hypothetical protein
VGLGFIAPVAEHHRAQAHLRYLHASASKRNNFQDTISSG